MSAPVVAIVGFPRSGSSLTMQMLQAGGFPCDGTWPAFEDYQPHLNGWHRYRTLGGKAVKILDAMLPAGPPPKDLPQSFILLRRDTEEQAKSFAKFARIAMGIDMDRMQIRTIERSFRRDYPRLRKLCGERGPVLELAFEDLVGDPRLCAARMADHVGARLDIDLMVAQVVARGPECYAGMLELDQLADRRAEVQP